jgi:RecA-family ATPase
MAGIAMMRRLPITLWPDLAPVGIQDRLVRGLLGENVLAVIYGEPGSGKSFAAFDIGAHVALGWPWLGHKVTPGGVLYVAAEGAGGWSNRVEAFCRHHPEADRERLPFAFILAAVNLGPADNGGDVGAIIAASQELQKCGGEAVKLIVVDTLARAMPGGNENAPEDMGAFVEKCDAIRRRTGATVLIAVRTCRPAHAAIRPCGPPSIPS